MVEYLVAYIICNCFNIKMKIDIKPVAKPRQTQSDKWNERPVVMRYRAFCDDLRLKMGDYRVPGAIRLTFHVPMPKSWTKKKKRERDGKPHLRRPDVDNFTKAFLDALTDEDNYIWHTDVKKLNSRKGAIEIEEIKEEE